MREKNWKYKLEELVLTGLIALVRLPGLDRASAMGGFLGRSIGPRLGITRRAQRRITRAMPELSETEVDRIVTAMWDNLGRVVFEYAHIDTFRKPEEAHRIEVVGAEELRAHQAAGHGGLMLSGHFGNFELLPVAMNREGFKGGEVYRPANNPYVNEWMLNMRSAKTGSVQIPKGRKGTRDLLTILRNNGFVAMLFDQKMNEGIEVTLFDIPSMTTPAPAGLAIRLGVSMFPVYIERLKGANFRVTVYPALAADPLAEPMGETVRLTQVLNDFLEARIREKPENWFWLHNRWADKD